MIPPSGFRGASPVVPMATRTNVSCLICGTSNHNKLTAQPIYLNLMYSQSKIRFYFYACIQELPDLRVLNVLVGLKVLQSLDIPLIYYEWKSSNLLTTLSPSLM